MTQSFVQMYTHIVFSTKNRANFLNTETLREETHAYLAGVCKNMDSPVLIVGGVADHIHILCLLSRNYSVKKFIQNLKINSSKWVKTQGLGLEKFFWQVGYGAFSISPSHVESVRNYIANQEAHHHKESFQEEFLKLLKKYNIEYDERYVWD